MSETKRKNFTGEFKAKVALEATDDGSELYRMTSIVDGVNPVDALYIEKQKHAQTNLFTEDADVVIRALNRLKCSRVRGLLKFTRR